MIDLVCLLLLLQKNPVQVDVIPEIKSKSGVGNSVSKVPPNREKHCSKPSLDVHSKEVVFMEPI